MKKWCIALLLIFSASAQAKVFNLKEETFAAYFGMTGGPSSMGQSAFENEAGTGVTYTSGVNYIYTGEFGVIYSRPRFNLRFGLEILRPQYLENLVGHGSSDLYTETSSILGYAPKVTLEVNLVSTDKFRTFIEGSLGAANVTVKNSYTLTAAGQSAYPGMDTDMEAKGSGTLWSAGAGCEILMSDTTTFALEAGYRSLDITNLKYSKDRNLFGTTHVSGDPVLDNGGSRNLNFTGAFIGAAFRFYLQ